MLKREIGDKINTAKEKKRQRTEMIKAGAD
jgi:hypothetical protein